MSNEQTAGTSTGSETPMPSEKQVQPCDFRRAGIFTDAQLQQLAQLHQEFVEKAAYAIGAYLRFKVEMILDSAVQVTYGDFIRGTQGFEYVISYEVPPLGVTGLLGLDYASAYSFIELLLGSKAATGSADRQFTEIDQHVLNNIFRLLAEKLVAAWHLDENGVEMSRQHLKRTAVPHAFSATENLVLLTFKLKFGEVEGTLRVLLPMLLALTVMRSCSSHKKNSAVALREPLRTGLETRLLDCSFTLTTDISCPGIPVRELIALEPGKVLALKVPVKTPVSLNVAGCEHFQSVPVRSGAYRAAQLLKSAVNTVSNDGK